MNLELSRSSEGLNLVVKIRVDLIALFKLKNTNGIYFHYISIEVNLSALQFSTTFSYLKYVFLSLIFFF